MPFGVWWRIAHAFHDMRHHQPQPTQALPDVIEDGDMHAEDAALEALGPTDQDSDSGAEASEEEEGVLQGSLHTELEGPADKRPPANKGGTKQRAPPCAVCSEPAARWWSTCPQCSNRAHVECLARVFTAGVRFFTGVVYVFTGVVCHGCCVSPRGTRAACRKGGPVPHVGPGGGGWRCWKR